VPVGRPGPLADRIAALLLDPLLRESLGHQGRHHVLTTHDVRHTAEAVAGVYRELLGAAHISGAGHSVHAPCVEPTECRESSYT
jgi:hypothetical protein